MIPFIITASCLTYMVISLGVSIKAANNQDDTVIGLMIGFFWPFTLPCWGLYMLVEYLRLRESRKKRADLPEARIWR